MDCPYCGTEMSLCEDEIGFHCSKCRKIIDILNLEPNMELSVKQLRKERLKNG